MNEGREHGGDLDGARARFGDGDWLDLSTGINPVPYPAPNFSDSAWTKLPDQSALDNLVKIAARAFGARAPITAVAGAQAAIGLLPFIAPPGDVRVLTPTYNEYQAVFAAAGRAVQEAHDLQDLAGASVAVVVNPNNPDGRAFTPKNLRALRQTTGLLVVDESFGDASPQLSIAADAGAENLLVLKSFGKFYGLAGVRLGFALGGAEIIAKIKNICGPWPVSGAAIAFGAAALADDDWRKTTRARLKKDADRLDAIAARAQWLCVGGTHLFRLYNVGDSEGVQNILAQHKIWTRRFSAYPHWLRLGLPGSQNDWERLSAALAQAPL